MDFVALHQALAATDNPSLPGLLTAQCALRGMWALVLMTLAVRLLHRRSRAVQAVAALVVGVWVLMPGSGSPAYWLGLAFMAPSWTSVGLCIIFMYPQTHTMPVVPPTKTMQLGTLVMAVMGIALGWLLLADMLLWLPLMDSVYAWGFSPWAVLIVSVMGIVPLLLWGMRLMPPDSGAISVLVLPVFALIAFVFTRLPSGNVWDALLDPWLWFLLHVFILQKCVQFVRQRKKKPSHHEPTPSRSSV